MQPKPASPVHAFANSVALVALALTALFALRLAAGVLVESYANWLDVSGTGGLLQAIDRSTLGGLARAVALGIATIVSLIALSGADRGRLRLFVQIFGAGFMLLAAVLLAAAAIKFNLAGVASVLEYAGYLGLSAGLVILAAVLAVMGRAPHQLRYYGAPFVGVLLLQLALMVFSRGLDFDWTFGANLGLIVLLGVIQLIFVYAAQLARAGRTED